MDKRGQFTQGVTGKTLQDLYLSIMMDTGLSQNDRQRLLQELDRLLGSMPTSTPLQAVMWKLSGAGIGYLIAKYFNMGMLGQGVLAATGLGLGTLINNRLSQQHVSNIYSMLNT